MRITKIETQKRTPGRVNVYADGEFVIGLSKETLIRAGLRVGDELSPTHLDHLTRQDTIVSAKEAALRLLSVRPRSERELLDRLREKEFDEHTITRVLAELREAGLVNDHEFACTYIRNTLTLRPVGELQLRQKLLLLGVPRDTVDEALRVTLQNVDMHDVALKTAQEYHRRMRAPEGGHDPRKLRQKTAAHLARRGYPWSTITSVLKSLGLLSGGASDDE